MKQEPEHNRQNPTEKYHSPTANVITLKTSHTILTGSPYGIDPTEMEEENVF